MSEITIKDLAVSIEKLSKVTESNSVSIEKLAQATMNGFAELRAEMTDMKTELRTEISDMKTELRTEMSDMKVELRSEMKSMKQEIIEVLESKDEQNKEDIRHLYTITEQMRKDIDTIRARVMS